MHDAKACLYDIQNMNTEVFVEYAAKLWQISVQHNMVK